MFRFSISMLGLSALVLAAPGGAAAGETISIYRSTLAESGAKTAEINTDDMRKILAQGSAVVIDTRSRLEFDAGHIPGARSLDVPSSGQVAEVERTVGGDRSKALVLYCNGPFCRASRRLADSLHAAGFTNVRRYQLGLPIWRALGGPTAVELGGIQRVFKRDQTAVFIDARPTEEFDLGSLPGARNAPVDKVVSGELKKIDLPEDDFNRRIILFGHDGSQAARLARFMSKRPWHNVSYYNGSFDLLMKSVAGR
jgi:rhodanese-related sulfurtransferase